jgi:hypothetical protein
LTAIAAVSLLCAVTQVAVAPAADAHTRARHRSSGCGRTASYRSGRHHRRVRVRRCARHHVRRTTRHHVSHSAPLRRVAHNPAGRPSDAGCPGAGSVPTDGNLELMRGAVLCLEDRERQAHGESPLQPNAALARAAQEHSESMAAAGYFDHVGPDGTPLQRVRAAGYISSSFQGYEVGENLAWGTLWLSTPRAVVVGWMASAGHRANILDPHFRDTAVGVSPHVPRSMGAGQAGGVYTQDFGVVTGR